MSEQPATPIVTSQPTLHPSPESATKEYELEDLSTDETSRALLSDLDKVEEQPESAPEESAQAAPERRRVSPFIALPLWFTLSAAVVFSNKHIFVTWNFPFPLFLTLYHMVIATVCSRLLRFAPGAWAPRKVDMSWAVWRRAILPLAALLSGSVVLSNIAYTHLSISFVQMIKSAIPALTLSIQLWFKLVEFNYFLLATIMLVSLGCFIAAAGELSFSLFGFICQMIAVVIEALRIVLVQIILHEYKLDPLTSISLYAPVCAVLIGACQAVFEGLEPFTLLHRVGVPMLIFNGLAAFSLNFASMLVIESAGSLVLTLSGVVKDIMFIVISVLILGSSIRSSQIFGYAVALVGLVAYNLTGGKLDSPVAQRVIEHASALRRNINLPAVDMGHYSASLNTLFKSRIVRFSVPSAILVLIISQMPFAKDYTHSALGSLAYENLWNSTVPAVEESVGGVV